MYCPIVNKKKEHLSILCFNVLLYTIHLSVYEFGPCIAGLLYGAAVQVRAQGRGEGARGRVQHRGGDQRPLRW